MKKTLFFGLMAAALGFTACSDENGSIFNEKPQKGMTLNATVNGGIDTRANIDNTDAVWPFTFSAGDEVKVTNDLVTDTYTFSKAASDFTCDDATPTASATTWHAYYPSGAIDLTEQSGTIADVAAKYALSGATETPTTGSPSLSIDMKAKVAILKIVNAGGEFEINIKNSASTWVKGLSADDFEVTTNPSRVDIFSTSTAGTYYAVVPAGVQLSIYNGSIYLKSTKPTGFEAGKYYTLTVGGALWSYSLSEGTDVATKIVIETGVSPTAPDGSSPLNSDGNLWQVLDGTTLRVQTPAQHIKFDRSAYGFFQDYKLVTEITGFEKVDMSETENMSSMFARCYALTDLDLSSVNTSSVTNMSYMFSECRSLPVLDVTHFNTANVMSMAGMFNQCEKLASLDVTHFNTANVMSMRDMFSFCSSLTSLDVTHFNTSNVTNMAGMFNYCEKLTSLDVTNFITANVTNMAGMFQACQELTSLDVTNFNTANVDDMHQMFCLCKKLTSLDVTHFNTANVLFMEKMFGNCTSLTDLDVTHFNTEKVINMNNLFRFCESLTALDVSSFNIQSCTQLKELFEHCYNLTSLVLSDNFTLNTIPDPDLLFNLLYECGKNSGCAISGVSDSDIITLLTDPYYTEWNSSYHTLVP